MGRFGFGASLYNDLQICGNGFNQKSVGIWCRHEFWTSLY